MAFDWTDLIDPGVRLGGSLIGNKIQAAPQMAGVKEGARQFDIKTQRADEARAMLMPTLQANLGYSGSAPSGGYAPYGYPAYADSTSGGGGLGGGLKKAASIGGAAMSIPGVAGLAGKGVGALGGLLGGAAPVKTGIGITSVGSGGGIGGTLGALATNPATWAAAAGLGAVIAAKKIGQGRKAANRLTGPQGAQGQWDQIFNEVAKRESAGQINAQQRQELLSRALDKQMQAALAARGKNMKNDNKVIRQWIADFSQPKWGENGYLAQVANRYAGQVQ